MITLASVATQFQQHNSQLRQSLDSFLVLLLDKLLIWIQKAVKIMQTTVEKCRPAQTLEVQIWAFLNECEFPKQYS
jgi:hypothetical protein